MLRRIRMILPTRPLLIFVALIFIIFLPIICWNLEYSAYFIQGDLNYAAYLKRLENNRRLASARSYFAENMNKLFPFKYENLKTTEVTAKSIYDEIVIVVMSVNRDMHKIDHYEPKYLTQTMHTIAKYVEKDVKEHGKRWKNISIAMCNVDENSEKFYEFKSLQVYFDKIVPRIIGKETRDDNCRSRNHFISCLNETEYAYWKAKYILVIEDDMLMTIDTLNGLANVLDSLNKRFKDNIDNNLGYVQLYFPNHLMKYSVWDTASLLELLFLSVGLTLLVFLIYFRVHIRPMYVWYNLFLFSVLLFICLVAVIAIGRPHWLSAYYAFTKSNHLVDVFVKSAAAVLINTKFATEIAVSGRNIPCYRSQSKQSFLEFLAADKSRRILSVNHNLFKHIGLYSTFKQTILNPHFVD